MWFYYILVACKIDAPYPKTVSDTTIPKHNPTFKISVKIDGAKQYTGIGNSKQNAQQEAAKNLLRGINIL